MKHMKNMKEPAGIQPSSHRLSSLPRGARNARRVLHVLQPFFMLFHFPAVGISPSIGVQETGVEIQT